MIVNGRKMQRAWRPTTEQALDVDTPATVAEWHCPIDGGAVLTRPDRHGRAGVDFEWVCHTCSAHGRVHFRDGNTPEPTEGRRRRGC